MESVCDLISLVFLEFFSIFALGTKTAWIHQFFLLVINSTLILTILCFYVFKGSLFVSLDALSKATDIIDLFFPIGIHIIVISNFLINQHVFHKISEIIEMLDEKLKRLNTINFKKGKISSTMWFLLKFFCVHIIGLGIDVFVLIR